MGSPRNILVVEDHQSSAELMALVLKRIGHSATLAADCAEALSAAKKQKFDLVFCDMNLPDGDGCELYQQLTALYPIPGIATTGEGSDDNIDRCLQSGFTLHLLKPFRIEQIEQAIRKVLPES